MYPRKFALLIHVKGADFTILRKICRYCAGCELIIAHQTELEGELAYAFSKRSPGEIENPYLVLGTVDLKFWREGLAKSFALPELQKRTADFRKYLTFSVEGGGWRPDRRRPAHRN